MRFDTPRSGLRILVVDDDPGCLSSLEDLLVGDGHIITTANCGREAFDLARGWSDRQRPHLSILDYDVPDVTGIETYERLVSQWPDMGAIFISGDSSSDLERRVLSAGGFALVRKPLDTWRVRQTIRAFQVRTGRGDRFID